MKCKKTIQHATNHLTTVRKSGEANSQEAALSLSLMGELEEGVIVIGPHYQKKDVSLTQISILPHSL